MKKMVSFKSDFFELVPDDPMSFALPQLFGEIEKLPPERRRRAVKGDPALQERVTVNEHLWEGNLLRISMDDLPSRAKLTGAMRELDLDDDEGLGNENAFLYFETRKLLVLQRNRNGLSSNGFCEYYAQHSAGSSFTARPVESLAAIEALAGLKEPKRLRVALARAEGMEAFDNLALGTRDATSIFKELNAYGITLEISVRRTGKTMALTAVADWIRRLFDAAKHGAPIEHIEVYGRSQNDERFDLDFLDYRIHDDRPISFEPAPRSRVVPYNLRREALKSAYLSRVSEVGKILGWKGA